MHPDIRRFLKYTTISSSVFGCELIAFALLLKHTDIGYIGATVITFLAGISIQYVITRRLVFSATDRQWQTGYALFFVSATAGVAAVSGIMFVLVEYIEIPPLIARIAAAGVVGYLIYLFNAHLTFTMPSVSSDHPAS